jgi:hypothetical protein
MDNVQICEIKTKKTEWPRVTNAKVTKITRGALNLLMFITLTQSKSVAIKPATP